MTRSEEELRVGTAERERGRVRLRKYVTTEHVEQAVPVRRERVRVEREPITDANLGAATSEPDISEADHEVVLREEEPVVEELRKEQIDILERRGRPGGTSVADVGRRPAPTARPVVIGSQDVLP